MGLSKVNPSSFGATRSHQSMGELQRRQRLQPIHIAAKTQSSNPRGPPQSTRTQMQDESRTRRAATRKTTGRGRSATTEDAIDHTRTPVAYIVPLPRPQLAGTPLENVPDRFLVYLPPPPPCSAPEPADGGLQRARREETPCATDTKASTGSWRGAVKRIRWPPSGHGESPDEEFLDRVEGALHYYHGRAGSERTLKEMRVHEGAACPEGNERDTAAAASMEELVVVLEYPSLMEADPSRLHGEFAHALRRPRSRRHHTLSNARGLLLSTAVAAPGGDHADENRRRLRLEFRPSTRAAALEKYLAHQCSLRAPDLFPHVHHAQTEGEVLEALGWVPNPMPTRAGAALDGEEKEQCQASATEDELKRTMGKGAREWDKCCRFFELDPASARRKREHRSGRSFLCGSVVDGWVG